MEELHQNKRDKRRGLVGTLGFHAVLILLALLPFLKYPIPPPGQQGILVSLGFPDQGAGDDRPDTQNEIEQDPVPESQPEETVADEPEEAVEEEAIEEVEQPDAKEEVAEESSSEEAAKEVVTTEDPDAARIKKEEEEKKQAEALEAKQKAEAEAKKLAEAEAKKKAEAEAKQKAEAEAKKKAEAEAKRKAEYEAAKKQFGDSFGEGKGKTDTEGNQGDPNGDPDASRLEGISTGSGMVGGGLGGRGVLFEPKIKDTSQKSGKVVVDVCVNRWGQVISAKFTQKGSTTTDGSLIAIAERDARKFKFSESSIDKQCGTITIDFRVR